MIMFFGFAIVLSTTFFAKDNEFLLQLPVKNGAIFFAKFFLTYISELLVTAIMLVPLIITYTVAVNSIVSLPIYFYVLVPFAIIFAPVIPLVIINILAFPIVKLINLLKGRSALSLIVLVVVFLGLMAGYMFIVPSIDSNLNEEGGLILTDAMYKFINSSANVF
jgi:ABC-2 type transport system permease protein